MKMVGEFQMQMLSVTSWDSNGQRVSCICCYSKTDNYVCLNSDFTTGSMFGKPNKVIHVSGVQCNGDEIRISECSAKHHSLEEGKKLIPSVEVAGVICYTPTTTSIATSTTTSIATPTHTTTKLIRGSVAPLSSINNDSSQIMVVLVVLVTLLLIMMMIMR